jgi:hypothetical protein
MTLHPRRPRSAVGPAPASWVALGLRHVRALRAADDEEAARRFDEGLSADLDQWRFQPARLLTHRYRVFPKLGITARTELAAALAADSPGVRACGAEGADPVQSHAARTTLATSSPGRSRTP